MGNIWFPIVLVLGFIKSQNSSGNLWFINVKGSQIIYNNPKCNLWHPINVFHLSLKEKGGQLYVCVLIFRKLWNPYIVAPLYTGNSKNIRYLKQTYWYNRMVKRKIKSFKQLSQTLSTMIVLKPGKECILTVAEAQSHARIVRSWGLSFSCSMSALASCQSSSAFNVAFSAAHIASSTYKYCKRKMF